MSDWKELDKYAPLDVFLNDSKYEIQFSSNGLDGWGFTELTRSNEILEKIKAGFLKYRYRLKPLESIRITKGLENLINDMSKEEVGSYCKIKIIIDTLYIDGRKVEIIGE